MSAFGERAACRFLEFFTAHIRNANTRRAYARDVRTFLTWCEAHGVTTLEAITSLHVAAYVEALTQAWAAPTAKRHLAAIRHLLDWLVTGQVVPTNPAASVRGPSHVVRRGKTPVLAPEEARAMLDAIDVTTPVGLRDRALIGLMVYSFARIGAALSMKVEDAYTQNRRLWVRLHEKGGKRHEIPCHHNLETYLHAYIDAAGIGRDLKGPLFRTIRRGTGLLSETHMAQADAYTMIRRRAEAAGPVLATTHFALPGSPPI
ncbi:integrase [Azorhizobium oxalatiphilum]|uniref:Integrase n=1 Tax=Azorhizobium oxalatiphilum TaxID=980631 RepID=A0A917CAC0_9HYPH|nr:integrase [Azorhizobium oxalatiphilum]